MVLLRGDFTTAEAHYWISSSRRTSFIRASKHSRLNCLDDYYGFGLTPAYYSWYTTTSLWESIITVSGVSIKNATYYIRHNILYLTQTKIICKLRPNFYASTKIVYVSYLYVYVWFSIWYFKMNFVDTTWFRPGLIFISLINKLISPTFSTVYPVNNPYSTKYVLIKEQKLESNSSNKYLKNSKSNPNTTYCL